MNFEKPQNNQNGENVVDFAQARQKKEEQKAQEHKIVSGEQKEDFADSLMRYKTTFESDNQDLNKSLENREGETEEEGVLLRRKIRMNKEEIQRILFVLSRYRHKRYEDQIGVLLKECESADQTISNNAKLRLAEVENQMDMFREVFEDYNLQEEVRNVEELQGRISDALFIY